MKVNDGQRDPLDRESASAFYCCDVNSFLSLLNNEQHSHFKLIIQVRVNCNER